MAEQLPAVATEPVTATVSFDDETHNHLTTAGSALTIAQAFEITSSDDCQEAVNERNANLKEVEWLEARLEYVLSPFTEGVKRVRALFKPKIDRRKEAIAYLNPLIVDWTQKEQRRVDAENAAREEAARKIRQQAEQDAAAELARANQEAEEKRRQAAEQETARQKAIAEGDATAAQEAARKAAELTEQAGHVMETAHAAVQENTLQAAAAAPTPLVASAPIAGNQLRDKWVAELRPTFTEEQAMLAIIDAIVNGTTLVDGSGNSGPRHDLLGILKMDLSALNKLASSLKKNMIVPGYVAMNRPIAAGSKK